MGREPVGFGIDGHGTDPEVPAGTDNANGNFSAVGNQEFHSGMLLVAFGPGDNQRWFCAGLFNLGGSRFHDSALHSGMFPCFLAGIESRLFASSENEVASFRLNRRGRITSSK